MKNVTKILTAVVLCAALFASSQRTEALGGHQFWADDEANIAVFPAQVNNHGYVQLDGIGTADEDTKGGVAVLLQNEGTTWGFNYGSDDWVNMHWGDGQQGISFGLANYSNNKAGTALVENTGYSLGYGNTFGFGEVGIHYADSGVDGEDATLDVYVRPDFGFWLFDNTYVAARNLTGDMHLGADFYSTMNAGGTDIVYGWGLDLNMADVGYMHQTATLGVEANMTDWATFRAGYNWAHVLSADDAPATADTMNCGDAMDEACGNADDGIAETGKSSGAFSWGLGFNWGGLTADFTVSSSLLLDPVGLVSARDAAAGLTDTGITLTYSF